MIAISFGWLIGGIIVIENVFKYPGLGRLLLFAIDRRGFPLMQAIAIVVVLGVVFANLIADLLYAAVNPVQVGRGVTRERRKQDLPQAPRSADCSAWGQVFVLLFCPALQ